MTVKIEGLDALRELKGHIGFSPWREITQDRVNVFADATDDHQWIHLDEARAAEGPYGRTIAHGFLTLSLMPSFMDEIVEITGISMAVNYGLESLRFPAPVPTGSRIRASLSAAEVRDVKGGVQVVWDAVVEVEDAAKPSCVARLLNNFYA